TLLPRIREDIREEFRTGSGSSNAGGNPPPVTIHTWLERFNKQKPHSFEKATVPNALQAMLPQIREEIREEFRTGSGPSNVRMTSPFLSPTLPVYRQLYTVLAKALQNSKVSFLIPTRGIYGEEVVSTIAYEEEVSTKVTLRKSLLPSKWRLLMTQIIQCLGGKTGGFDQITDKDAIIVNNWALNPNQPEEPPFTKHMLAICALDKLVVFKAPKTSLRDESVSQGTKHGAKTGHKKPVTSKQPFVFSKEATKGGSSKAPTRHDVSIVFTAEVDPGNFAPSDFVPQQQDQTKSVSEGLETVLAQPTTEKGTSSTAIHGDKDEASIVIHGNKEEASKTIKLEDLAKLESDKDEPNAKTKDTSVPRSSFPMSSQIQELTNQVLILQSQKQKLKLEKNKAKAEAALLKAQPPFLNVEQLNELLVKSLQTEFSKILSSHDFRSSLPTKLKDLPSKFNELSEEIKRLKTQVHELELPTELKEIPTKLEDFKKTATSLTSQVVKLKTLQWEILEEFLSLSAKVKSTQAKLKTLDALPSLLLNVTKALNKFAKVLESTSTKAGDQTIPSAGQADTMPAEGEKDTNQATISQLF
nr:hypothetical protein [Tanacetum cinerariifolium]